MSRWMIHLAEAAALVALALFGFSREDAMYSAFAVLCLAAALTSVHCAAELRGR